MSKFRNKKPIRIPWIITEKQVVPLSYVVSKEMSSNISQLKIFLQFQEDLQETITTDKNLYSSIDKHTPMPPNGTELVIAKGYIIYSRSLFCNISHKTFTPRAPRAFGVTSFPCKKNLKFFSMVLITFLRRINKLHR